MNYKRLLVVVAAIMIGTCYASSRVELSILEHKEIEQKVDSLLRTMTLDEKIGQMTGLYIGVLCEEETRNSDTFTFDEVMLDTVIGKYKVGCILNAPRTLARTPERWNEILGVIQKKNDGRSRYPLYLWVGPKSWYHLYYGWNVVSSTHQYGFHFQS